MLTCEEIVKEAFFHLEILTDGTDLSPADLGRGMNRLNSILRAIGSYAEDYEHTDLIQTDILPGQGILDRDFPFKIAIDLSSSYGLFRVPPHWYARSNEASKIFYRLFNAIDPGISLSPWSTGFSGNRREYSGNYPYVTTGIVDGEEDGS